MLNSTRPPGRFPFPRRTIGARLVAESPSGIDVALGPFRFADVDVTLAGPRLVGSTTATVDLVYSDADELLVWLVHACGAGCAVTLTPGSGGPGGAAQAPQAARERHPSTTRRFQAGDHAPTVKAVAA